MNLLHPNPHPRLSRGTEPGSAPVISVRGLSKHFGPVPALDGLDLEVAPGEVHGFLGPNGAGKSTTIRVLLGLLRADSGEVTLFGNDPWRSAADLHSRLAYVPGDVNLWPNLTGGEVISLLSNLRGTREAARTETLIDRFELDPTKRARTYSKGNRQKVALVAALASRSELLILDEPTSGLDPLMEAVFQECVGEARDEGRTVLLSSHILDEVEKLCDRVSIIRAGRTVERGTLRELRHLSRTTISAETRLAVHGLERLEGVHDLRTDTERITFEADGPHLGAAIAHLAAFDIASLVSQPPSLDKLFLRHYQHHSAHQGQR